MEEDPTLEAFKDENYSGRFFGWICIEDDPMIKDLWKRSNQSIQKDLWKRSNQSTAELIFSSFGIEWEDSMLI